MGSTLDGPTFINMSMNQHLMLMVAYSLAIMSIGMVAIFGFRATLILLPSLIIAMLGFWMLCISILA
jgi:hypothetical protein